MSLSLTPYLNFNATCEEAMTFYKSVLGGDLEITRFKDTPMDGAQTDPENVMNSTLKTPDITFMASDTGMGQAVMGDSVSLALSGVAATDSAKLQGFFSGLSEGGTVTMPLSMVPWGAEFGMFTDKFGIHWMVNIDQQA